MVDKYNNPLARIKQGGFSAPHLQDFLAHTSGGDFRHVAGQIDMSPQIPSLPAFATTVQSTLEQLENIILTSGTGFISIGDGYHLGSYNVGSIATPTLYDAFNAAFVDPRLVNGGVILLIAGTYTLTQTVVVPAGITICGEMAGSVIIAEMSETPMFVASHGADVFSIGGDSGSGSILNTEGAPSDYIKFFNLHLFDNKDGNIKSGGKPIPTMQTVPMIRCENGSNVICENVRFIGKIYDSALEGRAKTLRAIGYMNTGPTGTKLQVSNCYFDGLKTGIDFAPDDGDSDTLVIERCRARVFGTEDSGVLTDALNCFASFTLCNANFSNNYILGGDGGVYDSVNACFVLTSASGASIDNCKVVMIGNSGGPNGTSTADKFFINESLESIVTVKTGNSWGRTGHNDWFVIAGVSEPSNNNSLSGDFVGTSAIDMILTNVMAPATIVLNPGSYDVTIRSSSYNGRRFNLLGNKIAEQYPVVYLNITDVTTTYNGSRYAVFGHVCKSIHFRSKALSSYHAVMLGVDLPYHGSVSNAIRSEVYDCKFTDVALIYDVVTTSSLGLSAELRYCYFYQTATYADNICVLIPPLTNILMDNCSFWCGGYIGGIGNTISALYGSDVAYEYNVTISNCVMLLEGQITADSPLGTDQNMFFWVNLRDGGSHTLPGQINLINTKILAKRDGDINTAALGAAVLDTEFYWVGLFGDRINIDNCTISGADQKFTFGGDDFAITNLSATPGCDMNISNTRFLNGGSSLYIDGTGLWSTTPNSGRTGSIVIENCQCISESTSFGRTLVSIGYDVAALDLATTIVPQVILKNSLFVNRVDGSVVPTYLSNRSNPNNTDDCAVIEIFAPGCDVQVYGNRMFAGIVEANNGGLLYSDYSGLLIDNYNATAGNSDKPRMVFVHDNNFELNFPSVTVAGVSTVSCSKITTHVANIHNNRFNMCNSGGGATLSMCLSLTINDSTGATAYSDSIVEGNIFSRIDPATGTKYDLKDQYVLLAGTGTGPGMFVDNSFDSAYINAALTETLISDASSGSWIIERNKNQSVEIYVAPGAGVWGPGHSNYLLCGDVLNEIEMDVDRFLITTTPSVTFGPIDMTINTPGDIVHDHRYFFRDMDLMAIIPPNTYFVAADAEVEQTTATAATSNMFYLALHADGIAVVNDSDNVDVGLGKTIKLHVDGTSSHKIGTTLFTSLIFGGDIEYDDSNPVIITYALNYIIIKYRW